METTTTIRRPHGVRHIPGFVDGSLVAHVHRRAAEAALLRDRRLELAVDDSGHLHVRMVDGVRPAPDSDRGVRPTGGPALRLVG